MTKKNISDLLSKIDEILEDSSSEEARDFIREIKRKLNDLHNKSRDNKAKFEREILLKIKKIDRDPFSINDLRFSNIDLNSINLYRNLRELVKRGKIQRIGQGLYSIKESKQPPTIKLSRSMEDIRRLLSDNGISFSITGLDVLQDFINLIPKRSLHLIYVIRGSGEWAKGLIEERFNKMCLFNPSKRDIRNYFIHYNSDLIILREVGESAIEYQKDGIATIEKALVDIYFEVTRKRIPLELPELANILKNSIMTVKIDYKKLLRAASRRYVESDFLIILQHLGINISEEKLNASSRDKEVKDLIKLFR